MRGLFGGGKKEKTPLEAQALQQALAVVPTDRTTLAQKIANAEAAGVDPILVNAAKRKQVELDLDHWIATSNTVDASDVDAADICELELKKGISAAKSLGVNPYHIEAAKRQAIEFAIKRALVHPSSMEDEDFFYSQLRNATREAKAAGVASNSAALMAAEERLAKRNLLLSERRKTVAEEGQRRATAEAEAHKAARGRSGDGATAPLKPPTPPLSIKEVVQKLKTSPPLPTLPEAALEQKLLVSRQKSVDEGNVREPSRRERAPSSRRSSVPCAASTSASSRHSLPRDGDAVDGDADQQTQRAAVEPLPLPPQTQRAAVEPLPLPPQTQCAAVEPLPLPPQRILTRIVSESLIAISSHVASSVASLSDPKLATELKIKALMGAETLDLVGLQKVIDEAERQEAVRKHSSLGATPEGGPEGYTDEAAATPTEIAEIAAIAGLEEAQQLYAAGKAATGGLERVLRDPPAVDAEYVRELRAAVDEYVRLKLPKGEALTAARAAQEAVSTAVADVRKHMSVRPLDLAVLEEAIMEASRARVPGEDEAMVAAREVLEAGTQALKALNVEVNKVPINAKGLKKALEAAKEPLLAGREAEGVIEKAEALLEAVQMLLDVQLPPEHRAHLDTEMVAKVRCRDSLGFVRIPDCNVPRHALCAPVC
jgi:hypothetical protein